MIKPFLVVAIISLFLIGCSNNDTDATGQDLDHRSVDKDPVESIDLGSEYMYPLTGMGTDEEPNNRIVSVMVNNHPEARPQSGLSQADMVFEILSEGNTTRLLAMFQSQTPDVVGPVRSARPYYFQLAGDYDAVYIYHGAADFIENQLQQSGIDNLSGAQYDGDGHLFTREAFRQAPHNSYLQFPAVTEVAEGRGYTMEKEYDPLNFDDVDRSDIVGDEVEEVTVSYGSDRVRYVYDETDEHYVRYNGNTQTVEYGDETPITLENVLIMETRHAVVDDQGRRDIDFESGGNAYLLQKGKVQKVQWESVDGRIIPVRDGEPVDLLKGQTWINVIPNNPGLSGISEVE
ncbi:Protein of unknown function [Pelagirhabdus alkalitolerans]|uniref:Lipoprotein YerB n=1 Tax=Pelagirhabdus alkalitolerans TaxID=1612202 RepID=A0A1G6ISW5_9BACI|nr:DUF3048 domain-containing protein [Pelagirhabdus alkalitolerans]SDC09589.1 Protein of unknown function [Pelagirhabdus alkalitolerans]